MIDKRQARTFEKISNLYDKVRTSYPTELIDDIIAYSGITQNGRILDVGCGTAQATLLFAQRGYRIIGLDVGQEMISHAKEKCSSYHKVTFKVEFSKERYLNLVISYGWVQVLPAEKRNNLIDDLQKMFKMYENPLIVPYKYILLLAKKN